MPASVGLAALAFLLLLPPFSAGEPPLPGRPLLVGVVPDLPGAGPGDEGVAIGVPVGGPPVDLAGFWLGDGETAWPLPSHTLDAGESAWFVGNRTAWATHGGPTPSAAWPPAQLQLANGGDEVYLLDGAGEVVDAIGWGSSDAAVVGLASPGAMLLRRTGPGGWIDTDGRSDWVGPRVHRVGESKLDEITASVQRLSFYASPDNIHSTLESLISNARQRLHFHVYSIRDLEFVDALAKAKALTPSLDLAVHVASNAVGTADDRQAAGAALQHITDAGGTVTMAGGGRYAYHHLKVLIADDSVAIQSENAVPEAFSVDGTWGNRGWGVVLHDAAALAQWFSEWMEEDRRAWDARPFERNHFDPLARSTYRLPAARGTHTPIPAATAEGPFRVTPVVSPDHTAEAASNPILERIGHATTRVWTQQLQLGLREANSLGWQAPDAFIEALVDAARRGVDVRIQVPAPDALPGKATGEAVAEIRRRAAAEGLPLAVGYLDRPGLGLLHNKGLIVDDALVVGSTNGNFHSRAANREVAVIVEGSGATAYHERLFLQDWVNAHPRNWGSINEDLAALPQAALGPLVAAVLFLLPRRPAPARKEGHRR